MVFSSGFGEMGEEGRRLEETVAAVARRHGIRLLGPNTLGLLNAFERMPATFSQYAGGATPAGPIAFVTQSGAFGTAIAALARRRGLGLGYFVNTGNEADVDFVQAMDAVLDDPRVRVGAGYIEGLKDGAGLVALAARALAAGKPLVVTKVGRTGAGARAAASHTGSLAGEDAVFDAVVRQCGIVRARNEEHMLDIVEAFVGTPVLPEGDGIGIVTQSGGAGVLMADRAEELGLSVPLLGEATRAALARTMPGFGATANPVDVTAQFLADPAVLRDSVLAMLEDPRIHLGIVWLQLMEAYVDTIVAIFNCVKAIPDALGPPPDPSILTACLPDLAKALNKLLNMLPWVVLPRMIRRLLTLAIETLRTVRSQLMYLQAQILQILGTIDRAKNLGDAGLMAICQCAQANVATEAANVGKSLAALGKLLGIINIFMGLIGGPQVPDLKNLAGRPLDKAIPPFDALIKTLEAVRTAVPGPMK